MPIRRSPNDARHPRPQGGRDHPEQVVAINRNDWSQSIGTPGRDHPVRADIFHVDEKTNIHVEPHPDQKHIALTTVVDGKPTVTITYAIDELLTFVQILLHNLDKIR